VNAKEIKRVCMNVFISTERRAHAPLGATAEVVHWVKVVIKVNHINRTAPSGCVARLVRFHFLSRMTIASGSYVTSVSVISAT
jgi:hypothetical protein